MGKWVEGGYDSKWGDSRARISHLGGYRGNCPNNDFLNRGFIVESLDRVPSGRRH